MTILSSIPYLFIIHLSLDISSVVKAEDQEDISYEPIFRIDDPGSFVREKREAALPTNYEVDIEISFPDYSMASAITSFLENNLKTLFLDNSTTLSSVDVAPACNLSGSVATCSCQKDYDCLGAQDPLTNTCTTTLPLQRYCRPKSNIKVSPVKLFPGDTGTITCIFNELSNVSWSLNSTIIADNSKYTRSVTKQNSVVVYELRIKDLQDSDSGTYTCSATINGTLQSLSTAISISQVKINASSAIETFCDGSQWSITCCSEEIDAFNVTWKAVDSPGIQSKNLSCSIYTLTADSTQCSSPQPKEYICHFQRNEGASASRIITIKYLKKANIYIKAMTPISAGKLLNITCYTDVNVKKIELAKDTSNKRNSSSDKNWVEFLKENTTQEWSGNYTCTAYQGNLSSSQSITMDVVALPRSEAIQVFPLQSFVTCGVPEVLKCCVYNQNYTVSFRNNTALTTGTPSTYQGNLTCYTYSQTVKCVTGAMSSISCVITNRLSDTATSQQMMSMYYLDGPTCKAMDIRYMLPETPSGKNYSVPCQDINPTLLGNIIYPCKDGKWGSKINQCYSATIFLALQDVKDLINGPDVEKNLPLFLHKIVKIARDERDNIAALPKNIDYMVEIISNIGNSNATITKPMMEDLLQTVDIMVNNDTAWTSKEDQSVTVLKSIENVSKNLQFNGSIAINESIHNVQLFGAVVDKRTKYEVRFLMAGLNGSVTIRNGSLPRDSNKVVSIAYSTMKDLAPQDKSKKINALVMSTVISDVSNKDLDKDIFNITMTFTKSNESLKNPDCVWLDLDNKKWTNSGCTVLDDSEKEVKCSCNHLTSFSNLMGEGDAEFLAIITYVGIGVSILCLVITLIIESVVWRSVIKNKTSYMRHVCLVNICVTLLIADIWFIIGAALAPTSNANPNLAACATATFFTFYFYLSLFFWMLVLGLILFYRLIYILHDMSRRIMMIIAFTLGYGCPLLIAVITVASTAPNGTFVSQKICWLSADIKTNTFLAFVIPALTIVFVNFIILIVVICKLLRPTIGERPRQEERQNLVVIAKSIAVLTPLLGTSWGFGLGVSLDPSNMALHGIFATLNSFQGLFILISTVLLDRNVRTAVRSSISTSYWSTLRTKIQTSSTNSTESSKIRRKGFGRKEGYNFSTEHLSTGASSNSTSVVS